VSDYNRKKLWEALYVLVGASSIQERLSGAGMMLVVLKPDDFAPEHREEFQSIMESLTRVRPQAGEGSLEATTRTLTLEQGRDIAQRILGLYTKVRGGI
jgi:hypothetical protein